MDGQRVNAPGLISGERITANPMNSNVEPNSPIDGETPKTAPVAPKTELRPIEVNADLSGHSVAQLKSRIAAFAERAESRGHALKKVLDELRHTSPEFAAEIEALRADLNGTNLAPIYAELRAKDSQGADTGAQWKAIELLEHVWMPDAANVGESYNGPLSEDGEPFYLNLEKWKVAKEVNGIERHAVATAAIERDMETMLSVTGSKPLAKAVNELFKVAFAIEGVEDSDLSPFDCSLVDDIPGHVATLRVMRVALDELERLLALNIENQRQWLRESLAIIEEVAPEST